MLKFLLVLLVLCSPKAFSSPQEYSIIFIHIGKVIPSYAKDALTQARLFNKKCPIILLANQEALDVFTLEDPSLNITFVPCEGLILSKAHEQFREKTTLNTTFREGFWLYTSERFLYLDDLISQYKLKNVFHLEYDNMLYADLGNLLPIFQMKYKGIGATFDNDDRCIPGFVYIPHAKAMNELASYFAMYSNKNTNDMQILALFKNTNPSKAIDHLPIIPKEYAKEHLLISPQKHVAKHKSRYYANIDLFQSVFDAAALGQFLGGIDPRNGKSVPGFINESCVFNPSLLTIEWFLDEEERNVPYIVYANQKYKINNLHIHCKNLKKFASMREIP